jgi:hypothetical protein
VHINHQLQLDLAFVKIQLPSFLMILPCIMFTEIPIKVASNFSWMVIDTIDHQLGQNSVFHYRDTVAHSHASPVE